MSIRSSLTAVLLLLAAPVGLAQSLAELRFEGVLTGASRVEVEVGANIKGTDRRLDVHVFLGRGTTGSDLATLVASRLDSSGFHVHLGEPDAHQSRTVFIEKALFVNARASGGLRVVLTACEGPPASLSIQAPPKGQSDLRLEVTAGTFNPADRSDGVVSFEVDLVAGSHESRCSEQLLNAAGEARWMTDRPRTESWRPIRMANGARFSGLSVTSRKGWRMNLDLRSSS